jgi:MFS family permease
MGFRCTLSPLERHWLPAWWGLVVGGIWSDSAGPPGSVWQGVTWFVVGLVIAGLAPSMWVLVAGRIVQGFGVVCSLSLFTSSSATVSLRDSIRRCSGPSLRPGSCPRSLVLRSRVSL